jgi:hypothetical protein
MGIAVVGAPLLLASSSAPSSVVVITGGVALIGVVFALGATLDYYDKLPWCTWLETAGQVFACGGALLALFAACVELGRRHNEVVYGTLIGVLLAVALVLVPPALDRRRARRKQDAGEDEPKPAYAAEEPALGRKQVDDNGVRKEQGRAAPPHPTEPQPEAKEA